jgi:hypothetical protein
VAKRSPILGYNHNVRYRGLIFHVQTEDSGVLSPHLFTHLFHHGVIVSTRKYVYDAGSTEEAIKSLMQAQHKAVMKELRRGIFDDKIDRNLAGTPGLLPREGAEEPADIEQTAREAGEGADDDGLGGSTVIGGEPAMSREVTLEVTLDEPALGLRPTEQAVTPPEQAVTLPPMARVKMAEPPRPARVLARAVIVDDYETTPNVSPADSQPVITIQMDADEPDTIPARPARNRRPADTETNPWDQTRIDLSMALISDGVPGMLSGAATIRTPGGEATGPVPSGNSGPITTPLSQRTAKAVGAASLPPARPIARPPTRPAIPILRPMPTEDRRTPPPDALEAYALTMPSAELPDQAPERPGQYSQHKKISSRISPDFEHDGAQPPHPPQGGISQIVRGSNPQIPQSAQRATPAPVRTSTQPASPAQRATPAPGSMPGPIPGRPGAPTPPSPIPVAARMGSQARAVPQPARPIAAPPQRATPMPMPAVRAAGEPRPRTPTPQRVSMTPAAGTPGLSPGRPGTPSPSSGVVMTRPAVIVGSPAKPAMTSSRVRKARETEGRGFGQGLISEKSLDEVILAYLSEDAEDK